MKFSHFKNEEWSVEHADACPAFVEMTGAGFTRNLYDSTLPVYRFCAVYFRHGECDWTTLVSDHQRIGREIVEKFMKDNWAVAGLNKRWLKKFQVLKKFFRDNYQKDLTKLSDQELLAWSRELHDFYRDTISMPGFIDGYTFYADKRFNFLIQEFCAQHSIKNSMKIFSVLSSPVAPSFFNEEENDLIKIARGLAKLKYSGGNLQEFLADKNTRLLSKFGRHLKKYVWIKSSYYGYQEYSWQDLEAEVAKILTEKKKSGDVFRKNFLAKKVLIKKYKFTPEILAITRLTEIFVKWQDQRKVYTLTFVTLKHKLLEEISRRAKINLELLKYSENKELKNILYGVFDRKILSQREKGCLFLYKNGRTAKIILGRRADDFLKMVSRVNLGDIKEIKGMTASLGRATGKVKIIMTAKNIHQVKDGDILVAPMTRPEHLAGMHKAAAIITDDGGITCHAAIVSRELKIPCIIGTKIATKVLRDGDLVEVNAEKGIVKILK